MNSNKNIRSFLSQLPSSFPITPTSLTRFLNYRGSNIHLSNSNKLLSTHQSNKSSKMSTGAVPATCCGREGGCICAAEATCSCGKQSALHCTCEKSTTENKTTAPRCSCTKYCNPSLSFWASSKDMTDFLTDQRPAGQCTCSRANTENAKPAGSTCACGKRDQGKALFDVAAF